MDKQLDIIRQQHDLGTGEYLFTLSDGTQVRVAQSKAQELKTVYALHEHVLKFAQEGMPRPPVDNFVKIGQIADEIVRGLEQKKFEAAADAQRQNVAQLRGFGFFDERPQAPTLAKPSAVEIKEFPAPALDHRHMHGGLFVDRRS